MGRIAVTAGGSSVYELMASGVPFVVFGFSDDQVILGEKLERHKNAIWAGRKAYCRADCRHKGAKQ